MRFVKSVLPKKRITAPIFEDLQGGGVNVLALVSPFPFYLHFDLWYTQLQIINVGLCGLDLGTLGGGRNISQQCREGSPLSEHSVQKRKKKLRHYHIFYFFRFKSKINIRETS